MCSIFPTYETVDIPEETLYWVFSEDEQFLYENMRSQFRYALTTADAKTGQVYWGNYGFVNIGLTLGSIQPDLACVIRQRCTDEFAIELQRVWDETPKFDWSAYTKPAPKKLTLVERLVKFVARL